MLGKQGIRLSIDITSENDRILIMPHSFGSRFFKKPL